MCVINLLETQLLIFRLLLKLSSYFLSSITCFDFFYIELIIISDNIRQYTQPPQASVQHLLMLG